MQSQVATNGNLSSGAHVQHCCTHASVSTDVDRSAEPWISRVTCLSCGLEFRVVPEPRKEKR
jgi:hypothetical protein